MGQNTKAYIKEVAEETVKIRKYMRVKKVKLLSAVLSVWVAGILIPGVMGIAGGVPVSAAETNVEASIPVTVREAAGTVIMEAEESDAPLPEQTELPIGTDKNQQFGPIRYSEPEDYHYKIYQRTGNEKNVIYDTTVYEVTVRVTNSAAGELEAVVWCRKDGEESKADQIVFSNSVKKPVQENTQVRNVTVYKSKTVKTGDAAPIAVLAAMSGISAGVLTAVERWKRKNEK